MLPTVALSDTLEAAMQTVNRAGKGIALVVDDTRHLIDVVTDGDLRRAILAGARLADSVASLLPGKARACPHPVAAPIGTPPDALLALMRRHDVRQLPLLARDTTVAGLATMDDLLGRQPLDLDAVIMAGGRGVRLRPLTDTLPKPMLPVGGRPLLEHTVARLREAGIGRVAITTRYLADAIERHFGDGSAFGVEVRYCLETTPLGTAGALAGMEADGPLLVLNGDVLSTVDYRAMLGHHVREGADLTMAVRLHSFTVPYGVVECDGARVVRLSEKPAMPCLINAGVYLAEPCCRAFIPAGERYDMTDLVGALLAAGRPVAAFALVEPWRDVGTVADYERAQLEMAGGASS